MEVGGFTKSQLWAITALKALRLNVRVCAFALCVSQVTITQVVLVKTKLILLVSYRFINILWVIIKIYFVMRISDEDSFVGLFSILA